MTPAELAALDRLENGEPLTAADITALTRLNIIPLDPAQADSNAAGPANAEPAEAKPGDSSSCGRDDDPARSAGAADAPPSGCTRASGSPTREVLDAGFTHRDGGDGQGFAAGGDLDMMEACWRLAAAADRAWTRGLGGLSDDELAGLMGAARRLASRGAALELAVITELAARRAGPGGAPGEHLQDEVAAVLMLTGRAAAARLALAEGVARLPAVAAGLAAGRIDVPRAQVFAEELAEVDDALAAAAIAAALAGPAAGMTTGRLRGEVRWLVAAFDPQAARERKARAERDARVEFWTEPSGTGAIAGRDLNLGAAVAADQHLDAAARWLQACGAPGGLDRLRAEVFLARLSGQPLEDLLSRLLAAPAAGGTAGTGTAGGPTSCPGTGPTGRPGGAGASDRPAPDAPLPDPGAWPPAPGGPARPPAPAQDARPAPGGLGGSVNLTVPLATWLGHASTPGRDPRYGTLDADTCRELGDALATTGRARWCITLTDQQGRAVAHGCARAGPGPPDTDRAAWLATVTITPVETGTCHHRRQSAGYQPSPTLRHIIKTRSPRCGFPGCRRPARRCDDDHTIPHHQGGRTCECNLHPLCRRHHRAKQALGWHLEQPEPGILIWTLPSGRTITTRPEPLPV